ncbi:hypothetical protein ACFO5Q_11815 [Kordiimonas lipolytica]|uniref:Uncharacterized protein n=1 Tax=Kordiimonas lipolytica TaxID=1662421 RepID=A0ABV8UDL4_9PROT|nr:hypothetical protein [Kordiimonas lipolytica]
MRFAMIFLALALVMGAPIAPSSVMNKAEAQATTTDPTSTLQAELIAAAGNPTLLQQIVSREQAAGNSANLATALANASVALAATDLAGAGELVKKAVDVAQGVNDTNVANIVGGAASTIATTAINRGDARLSADITTKVAIGRSTDVALGFVNAGGSAGRNIPQTGGGTGGDTGGGQQQQGGQQQTGSTTTTPVVRRTTRTRTVIPPRPRIPTTPIVPVIVEPNPQQAGSPT